MSRTQLEWDCYHLNVVQAVALHSSCTRSPPGGIGAVLVLDKRQLVTGYVGSIPGTPHCTDPVEQGGGCLIGKDGGCQRTIHAEMNALALAARNGVWVDGATCYCTLSPCVPCFKTLVSAGIRRFVYMEQYRIFNVQPLLAKYDPRIEFVHIPREVVAGYAVKDDHP